MDLCTNTVSINLLIVQEKESLKDSKLVRYTWKKVFRARSESISYWGKERRYERFFKLIQRICINKEYFKL